MIELFCSAKDCTGYLLAFNMSLNRSEPAFTKVVSAGKLRLRCRPSTDGVPPSNSLCPVAVIVFASFSTTLDCAGIEIDCKAEGATVDVGGTIITAIVGFVRTAVFALTLGTCDSSLQTN